MPSLSVGLLILEKPLSQRFLLIKFMIIYFSKRKALTWYKRCGHPATKKALSEVVLRDQPGENYSKINEMLVIPGERN